MNTDDGHSRSNIFLTSEELFPELFDTGLKKIYTGILAKKEYFDIKLGIIDSVDILGLPTEKLNGFKLSELETDIDCGEINRIISRANSWICTL